MFIKTKSELPFKQRWFSFLKSKKDARFYVASRPQFTSDILLNKEKLKSLVEQNFMGSREFDITTKVLYTK